MLKLWFRNRLQKILEYYNEKPEELTSAGAHKNGHWSPCDLILREALENKFKPAHSFVGFSVPEGKKCYIYICENKDELIEMGYISKKGWDKFHNILWNNYDFDKLLPRLKK